MPRQPNPELEQRILAAASRLWARGGEKSLTMRAVAKAAGTTTPTVYERYRDRDGILRALRLKTRTDLFAALRRAQSLREIVENYLKYALENRYSYEVLFDGVGRPPSLHEPWPSFNLMRDRLAEQIGGATHENNRIMLAIWCLLHGTAMLIIRGSFEGPLRTQAIHSCLDTVEAMLRAAVRPRGMTHSGPKWPSSLILGEGSKSRVGNGNGDKRKQRKSRRLKTQSA